MLNTLDMPMAHFVQETERRRLARDLHDGAVQTLTALINDLEHFRAHGQDTSDKADQGLMERLKVWHEMAADSLISMRQTLGNLRCPDEPNFELEVAIQQQVFELEAAHYNLVFEYIDCPCSFPYEFGSNIYAVIHESLINIRKHANASHIQLFIFQHDGRMHISVVDDGAGMSASLSQQDSPAGYQQGLIGMRERVSLLGGQISLESQEGKGTRIDIAVPLPNAGVY